MFDFTLFAFFPAEVRETIYGYVLKSDKSIRPHLCDVSFPHERAKFHDDNAVHHDATFLLMNLTRASKKLREESLPVFYSTNSFAVGADTTTYFAWLESIGRLDWVLRVNLVIPYHSNNYSAWILWMVSGFDKQVKTHDEKRRDLDKNEIVVNKPLTLPRLRQHPRYLAGGLADLNICVLLRMLSTSLVTSAGSEFRRRIVLPVSNASVFETDSSLRWLSMVTRGLGIEFRLVEQPGSAILHDRRVFLRWNRKYQGKDVATMAGPEGGSSEDVMKRAKELFPGIKKMNRPEASCHYRYPCFEGTITWYDMPTMGGGRVRDVW